MFKAVIMTGVAFGAMLSVSGAALAADPLKIGVATDMSGTYASLGEEVMRATRFAVDEATLKAALAKYDIDGAKPNPRLV